MSYIKKCINTLKKEPSNEVMIIHHDDADGITAASILVYTFENLGKKVKTICLEKMYREVIEKLHSSEEGKIIIYADIASPHAKIIDEYDKGKNLVIILDHHDAPPYNSEKLFNINPEFFGFSGEKEVSGSTICYIFSKQLIGDLAKNLAHIALIGCYEIPGPISGLNEIPLSDAIKMESIKYSKRGILIKTLSRTMPRSYLSKILTIMGSVGYYRGGPQEAIKACLDNFPSSFIRHASKLENERKQAFRKLLAYLYRGNLHKEKNIQWFYDNGVFSSMGTKVIGTFCSYLSYKLNLIDKDKYILGYMKVKREIPGIGELSKDFVKISVRTPEYLKSLISLGIKPKASDLLIKACEKYNGFADGHAYAASGIIEACHISELLNEIDNLVDNLPR